MPARVLAITSELPWPLNTGGGVYSAAAGTTGAETLGAATRTEAVSKAQGLRLLS